MDAHDPVSRRSFLAAGAAGATAAALAQPARVAAQTPATHVKPLPAGVFIDHGLNKETQLETLRGYLTPASCLRGGRPITAFMSPTLRWGRRRPT